MNEIKVFQHEKFGCIRIVSRNDNPWFIAKDVCEILGTETRDVRKIVDEDEVDIIHITDSLGRKQPVLAINESGLYNLVLKSRKEEAKPFRKWVTTDVLPNIRKFGFYMTDNLLEKTLQDPNFLITILTKYKEEKEKNEMLLHQGKLYTATEIAKEMGFRSAQELNEDLRKRGIQYKVNNTWVLTADYAEKGYTSIKQHVLENGKVIYDRKWTGLGREFLLKLYNKEGANSDSTS